MILSDRDIKRALEDGDITIEGFDESRLQPASYDLLLGNEFMYFDKHRLETIDPKKDVNQYMSRITVEDGDHFVLQAGEFALGITADYFGSGPKYSCELMGKSSLARLGLIIHTTAGFIDPGNSLNATLELYNTNRVPIKLYPGMKIAQVAFQQLSSPAEKPYGHASLKSKYLNARGVQASEMWKNFRKK